MQELTLNLSVEKLLEETVQVLLEWTGNECIFVQSLKLHSC